MSTLLGRPGERWPLPEAVDALGDSARRAGIPGLIWIAGIFYPSLNVHYDLVRGFLGMVQRATGIPIPGSAEASSVIFLYGPSTFSVESADLRMLLGMALLALPLYLLLYRLIGGLARVSDPRRWEEAENPDPAGEGAGKRRSPGLGSVWREGKGLGASALGLWIMLSVFILGVMVFLLGPLVTLVRLLNLTSLSPLLVGLILPILAIVLAYAVILQVLNQLALHSLAHNQRGVASALTHAWRLMRASPAGTLRAALVDLVLFASVILFRSIVIPLVGGGPVGTLLYYAFLGFAGVTRAGYWARVYRALGGLSAADHVPGLELEPSR